MSQASSPEELKAHLVDPQAALDELYRELAVRARCSRAGSLKGASPGQTHRTG